MRRGWIVPIVLFTGILSVSGARAAVIEDRASGTTFEEHPTYAGTQFDCLGAGLRKVFVFDAYALAFCVDSASSGQLVGQYVREKHPGQTGEALAGALEGDGQFYRRLALDPARRLVVMRALRNISRDKLSSAFRESLKDVLPQDKVEKVIGAIKSDATEGSLVRIASDGQRLTIDIAGEANVIEDPEVAREIWRVWLGPKSVTPNLRKSIAEHVAGSTRSE